MGLYDRDYYQDDEGSASGYFAPRGRGSRMMVTNVVLVTVAFWLVDQLNPGWLSGYLSLRADLLEHPWRFYQLATYALTHSPLNAEGWGLMHILFNMLVLWMFGREMEWKYGGAEFLRFYIATVVFAGLVWIAARHAWGSMNSYLVGASGGVAGVLFLYILNYPRRTLYFWGILGVPAWLLGAVIIVIDLAMFFAPGAQAVAHEAHLAGAAFGAAYFQFGWNFSRLGGGDWGNLLDRMKRRPKLKVHDPEVFYQDLDSEADALLAKIHRNGEESLTAEERKKLEDYSRRMRQKYR